jgi:MFS superfamily sulfate permease-like transporter
MAVSSPAGDSGRIAAVEGIEHTRRGRIGRIAPSFDRLPRYERSALRGDVLAGVAVAAMIVPKDLGYAGIAGIPVQNGLYAAAAGAIVYALFCTSRHISTGPSSSLAAVAGGAVPAAGVQGPQAADLVAAITLVTGALFLLLAVLRLGWVARFLSRAVHGLPGGSRGRRRDRRAAEADGHVGVGRDLVGRAGVVDPVP